MKPWPTSIDLKLISCKDLTAFNFFQKLTIYAVVSIATDDPKTKLTRQHKQQQRTQTDRDSDSDGTHPEWNHEARFDLGWLSQRHSYHDLFFRFKFRHDGLILGDKLIGECRVPFVDLIRDAASFDGVARFVSYEVRSGEGKPNGIFNFSYRLNGIGSHSSQILEGRISGYPVLAPDDCAPSNPLVQYPTSEVENPCCYPTVAYPPPPQPPRVSSGEYHYYYPPPPPPYPYPPPPPPMVQPYPPFGPGPGPEPHPWPSGPYFEHRW